MKVIFVSTTKIGENTTNTLKLLFFTINFYFVTSNQISTYRKLNLPLTSSIYFVFLLLEMEKKTQTDKSIPCVFLLCLKREVPQTFKSGSCNNLLPWSVCCWYNLLRWMFFILCDNWKTIIFMKNLHYSEISLFAMLMLSLKPVFWKKSIVYAISPY